MSWIRPHRNTNNLAADFRTNSEITIKMKISYCILYLLFVKTYHISFDIFYPTSSKLLTVINLFSPRSKQESIKLVSTIRSLLCGNLVYKVETSKVETKVALLCLLSPFIASITRFLFCTTQNMLTPVKNLHLSLYVCICLKNKRKIYVIVLAKGFIEDLGEAIMNLALIGFLCILGIQYILGNR